MQQSPSRPHTPESPWTNSLQDASATVDDLTAALANFSRVPSPELTPFLTCCCERNDCENHQAWLAFKSKLESRLILSAEVGQALLQRHEAYVRRHERPKSSEDVEKQLTDEIRELQAHNATLQKRLAQALVNSEVIENSDKVVHQELHEARMNIMRLNTQQVRAAGLESRLSTITQEKDDLQQERDNADQRARLAEARIVALRDRYSKMQDQLNCLHKDLEEQRSHRLELSEEILEGARARLKELHHPMNDQPSIDQDEEVIKMVESLVTSNETLKRDNGEMQRLLSESREDSRALQEELEELRASGDHKHSNHRFTSSLTSSIRSAPLSPNLSPSFGFSHFGKRAISVERGLRRSFEPLTPETTHSPLSPMDNTPWKHFVQSDDLVIPSGFTFELDEDSQRDNQPMSPERPRSQRALLLLTRSRGVQTEPWKGLLTPSPIPTFLAESTASSHDGKSEESSLIDAQPSLISALLERAASLLNRLTLSDAGTLTNRLKRQHLTGADVGHISRTTVRTVVSEVTMLRTNFRTLLEDEIATATLTRKDLRALFKLLKDVFTEMGEMRMTLNDVILDPSIASKISDMVLNPNKSGESGISNGAGWIAPIAKLFGGATDDGATNRNVPIPARSTSRGRQLVPPHRRIPKLEPAIGASATTVNVEFHTTGVGRAVTSTYSAHPSNENEGSGSSNLSRLDTGGPPRQLRPSSSIMGIFAGARPVDSQDPWIVVPKPQRKPISPLASLDEAANAASIGTGTATIERSTLRGDPDAGKLSRAVDAVIDVESHTGTTAAPSEFQTTLLQRTLRPRGFSDSSIRTTFINHGEEPQESPVEQREPEETLSSSVLAAFSRKVLAFRSVSSNLVRKPVSRSTTPKLPVASTSTTQNPEQVPDVRRVGDHDRDGDSLASSSPLSPSAFFPGLSTWSAAFEPGLDSQSSYNRNSRQDWLSAREAHGMDF